MLSQVLSVSHIDMTGTERAKTGSTIHKAFALNSETGRWWSKTSPSALNPEQNTSAAVREILKHKN